MQRLPPEERYRRGRRRTKAEPLAASWDPVGDEPADADAADLDPSPRGARGILRAYGWRIYAVPILIVLTVLAFTNVSGTRSGKSVATGASSLIDGSSSADTSDLNGDVVVGHEIPPGQQPNIPTAILPEGPQFTQSGTGQFHVIPGSTAPFGNSAKKTYKYTIEVEDGLDPASYEGDVQFARTVDYILQNKKSWAGTGDFAVQRVDSSEKHPDFRLSLTSPGTDHRPDVCGFDIQYEASCYRKSFDNRVVINLARWVRGAVAFEGDMGLYRQYAINHEVGHFFNHNHEPCPDTGSLAPVMMQQTFGVTDDYVWQLNQVEPGVQKTVVPKDGKVCKPNAWPNPESR